MEKLSITIPYKSFHARTYKHFKFFSEQQINYDEKIL